MMAGFVELAGGRPELILVICTAQLGLRERESLMECSKPEAPRGHGQHQARS